jgi:hypothetical protein
MTKTEERIKALEARVAALEARPPQVIYYYVAPQPMPYVIPPQGPQGPFWNPLPNTVSGGQS